MGQFWMQINTICTNTAHLEFNDGALGRSSAGIRSKESVGKLQQSREWMYERSEQSTHIMVGGKGGPPHETKTSFALSLEDYE